MNAKHTNPVGSLAPLSTPMTRRRALQLGALSAAAGVGLTSLQTLNAPAAHASTIFRDDFTGAWGSRPDGRWQFEHGPNLHPDGSRVNNELQHYTDEPRNVMVNGNGVLVITGRRENRDGSAFTSARMHTHNSFAFKHGWIEAQMILPRDRGSWPAFWLLPQNSGQAWPGGGEIDIMERRGTEPNAISGAVHTPAGSGAHGPTAKHWINGSFSDTWHTFALRKEPWKITWYCDGQQYFQVTPQQVPDWPFENHNYYIIINQAIGGDLGDSDAAYAASWPQETLVNYVLVNDA